MILLTSGFRAAVVAVPLMLIACPLTAQEAVRDMPARSITVIGEGSVSAVPDVADVSTGVITAAKTARDAMDRNSAEMERLVSALHSAGIADRDIQTSGLSLAPQYSRVQQPDQIREIVGYQASNQVTVTIRDVARVGEVIDRVIGAGSNSIAGVRFRIADPTALMDEARRKAMADAKRRADLLADAAGAQVGRVLRIDEGGGRMPSPRLMRMEARSMPVAPGSEDVAASVTVRYELN